MSPGHLDLQVAKQFKDILNTGVEKVRAVWCTLHSASRSHARCVASYVEELSS